MEFKKGIIILIMAVFLVSIASVCASDVNDTAIASEDNSEVDQTTGDVIGLEDCTDLASSKENEILGEGVQSFSKLNDTINGNTDKNIYLNGNYKYSDSEDSFKYGIVINRDVNIYGNGAIIDGNKEARIFQITGGNVVFYNITFVNGSVGNYWWHLGGAIYGNCKVINCTFKQNRAYIGGAMYEGSAVNCNFIGNTADISGGAMLYGSAVNCNFSGNNAEGGGAMLYGSAVNCTFTENTAVRAGAMFTCSAVNCTFSGNNASILGGAMGGGSAVNCTFFGNNADEGGAMYLGYKWNCRGQSDDYDYTENLVLYWDANNFTTSYGSGEKLPIQLKNPSYELVDFINYDVAIYKDGVNVKTYHCLSNDGLSLDLLPGIYTAELTVTYPGLDMPEAKNITLTVTDGTTFTDLNKTINDNANDTITLDKNYTFNSTVDSAFAGGIEINRSVTINGNGYTINADGKARIFRVTSEGVVLNEIAFINGNVSGDGGALNFNGNGTVTNCNFTDNNATSRGAAVYCYAICYVTGCTFINNNVTSGTGGALWTMAAYVRNCNFADNSAFYSGGALWIYAGEVTSCNFIGNKAITGTGGAVRFAEVGYLTNCNFTNNSANEAGAVMSTGIGDLKNCNFKNNIATSGDGGAAYIMLNGTVTNCDFADNSAFNGGAVYFEYYGTLSNCNFTANSAGSRGGAVYLGFSSNVTDCNFTGNTAVNGGAIHTSPMCFANVVGCDFADNSAFNGGAVNIYTGIIENCNFTNNSATNVGGAVIFSEGGSFADCNFEGNTASVGGAVSMFKGNFENCNFTGNNATGGSAINLNGFSGTNITNSRFLNNRANASSDVPFDASVNGNSLEIRFRGQNNLLNAIRSNGNVTFTNVTYWGAKGISNTGEGPLVLSPSDCEAGQNITLTGFVNGNILKTAVLTDEEGKIVLENVSEYFLIVRHHGDSYYTKAIRTISNVNVVSQTTTNRTVNITAKSNIYPEVMPGGLIFILPKMNVTADYAGNGTWWTVYTFADYGVYEVSAFYVGLDNVAVSNATITVNKIKTELTADAVTATYNINRDMLITLKDANGNPLAGASLSVDLGGVKTFVTDSNGQVKVSTAGLAPKTYVARIVFAGNADCLGSSADVKVVIKKAAPKIKAKKKTYKAKKKTKKFTITLKDNTGKPIKNAKVRLMVKKVAKQSKKKSSKKKSDKKKNYAKTNKKGKATFKVLINKKGKYNAKVKFYGDQYYSKATKTVKITIK